MVGVIETQDGRRGYSTLKGFDEFRRGDSSGVIWTSGYVAIIHGVEIE